LPPSLTYIYSALIFFVGIDRYILIATATATATATDISNRHYYFRFIFPRMDVHHLHDHECRRLILVSHVCNPSIAGKQTLDPALADHPLASTPKFICI
jgi:hypothetical protein